MLTSYANAGYLEAAIEPDVRINSEVHRALIDFQIKEGPQFSIDTVRIEGNQITRENVIERELQFSLGEVVKRSELLESQRQLYLTGLFQSVFIRPVAAVSDEFQKKDVLIELKEYESIEFNASLGYGTVEKARAKAGIYFNNIFGTARRFGITPRISFISSSTTPCLFNVSVPSRSRAS